MNKVVLAGNLGRDPEIRYTQAGKAVATLSLATSRYVKGETQTDWHKVVLFGKSAENCSRYRRGMRVGIDGEIVYTKWTDREGREREGTEIHSFSFVEWLGGEKPAFTTTQESTGYSEDTAEIPKPVRPENNSNPYTSGRQTSGVSRSQPAPEPCQPELDNSHLDNVPF